jgi:hypothetical protein
LPRSTEGKPVDALVLNKPGAAPRYRGGSWYQAALGAYIVNREPGEPEMRDAR